MLSLLDTQISRSVLRAARSKLRPLSLSRSRPRNPATRSTPQYDEVTARTRSTLAISPALETANTTSPLLLLPVQSSVADVRRYATGKNTGSGEKKGPSAKAAEASKGTQPKAAEAKKSSQPRHVDPAVKSTDAIPATSQSAIMKVPPCGTGETEAFQTAKPFDEIPGPSGIQYAIPFASTHLLYYPFTDHRTENMGEMLSKLQASHGPILRVKLGPYWEVLIENGADIEKVVQAANREAGQGIPPSQRDKGALNGMLQKKMNSLSINRLHCRGGVSRKADKAVAQHLLDAKVVAQSLSSASVIADDLLTQLQKVEGSPKDLRNLFRRYTLECAGRTCFHERPGFLGEQFYTDAEKQRVLDSYNMVVRCMGEVMTGVKMLYLIFDDPFTKRYQEAKTVVRLFERKMMREATTTALTSRAGKNPREDSNSLFVTLLDDKTLAEPDIGRVVNFILAIGGEAAASSLQMLLCSLATNLDKQDTLAKEIQQKVQPNSIIEPRTIENMPYLKAVVKESHRLDYPLSCGVRVTLSNNIVLSNYLVPAGTPIVVNSRRTSKNPTWFDHPHLFSPERWLDAKSKDIPQLAYLPFGYDASLWPTPEFALQKIYVAIIKIVQKYKVELPDQYRMDPVEHVYSPFRQPKEPLPFTFTSRQPDQTANKS